MEIVNISQPLCLQLPHLWHNMRARTGAVAALPPALAQEAWDREWGWAGVASLAQGRM